MRRRLLYAESEQMAALIEQADKLMESPAFRIVKDEGRTRAGLLACADGTAIFLKRTAVRSRFAGMLQRIAGSRASRALAGAKMVREAGFHCARPLAALDLIDVGAVCASYVASEALRDAEILSHFALGHPGGPRRGYARRKAVSDALARELRRLHDAGIYTRDLQETNIMVAELGGVLRFYFLDLEDFRRARSVSRRQRMLNLVHLDRSIGRFMSRAARLNFLYAYIGGNPAKVARRRLAVDFLELRQSVERRHRDAVTLARG
ncbi:MAG TPA: lipopolysaccharide kinase InaA family protein [Candidatus Binataceae bacterium]|nr:lipopolysaccharide kinase InaA family protein [Candidatus Binataceae bacterium]